ncbi:TPA: hypothetical protein DEP21_00880 [Patescibacteria group bacterium]|nr:hypothetical protein [Candidatus Gracilibacteria bacterium]
MAGCSLPTLQQNTETCEINTTGTNCIQTGIIQEEIAPLDLSNFENTTEHTLLAIKNKDMKILETIAGNNGIRFSPYAYIDTDKNIILAKDGLQDALSGNIQYVRGNQDGSGEPIIMTFTDYLDKFVYDVDFISLSETFLNQNLSRGNSINNATDVYSGKQIIEYYVPGIDPQYEGMDRRSLSLVFEQQNGQRHLIGIIHNQWTI